MTKIGQHYKVVISNYLIQITTIISLIYFWNDVSLLWIALGYFFFGFCILDGYLHRYLAHRAYEMPRALEIPFCIISTLVLQNSAIAWASNHVTHHKYSDKEGDSHPASDWFGTWFWIGTNKSTLNPFAVRKLITDKLYVFQQDHYFKIFFTLMFILFLISPMFTLCFVMANIVFGFHVTSIINVLTHKIGYRNFDIDDNSTNLNIFLIPSNLHNNHHKYPRSINNSTKWYEIDLTYYFIKLIKSNQH